MRKYLCPLLALLTLAGAGCGESAPSKKEFMADLDAVCKKSKEKIQRLDPPQSLEQIPKFVRESRVVVEDSIEEAEKLDLPKEDRKGFENYISESKKSLSALDELEKAAEENDRSEVRRVFQETTAENQKRDAQAERLGLKECGSG